MEHHLAVLLRRLNPYCARALEDAAVLCQTRAHPEILPEHWLLKLLEQGEGDLTVLARRYEWDMDTLWLAMLGWLGYASALGAQPSTVVRRHPDPVAGSLAHCLAEQRRIHSLCASADGAGG